MVRLVPGRITRSNRGDPFPARWAFRREGHRVEPGLYALGNPTPDSPAFVTANYTLSFDAPRLALAGIDGYVLDRVASALLPTAAGCREADTG